MRCPRLLATLVLWLSLPAAAGVDLGGNLPIKSQHAGYASLASLNLRGAIKGVRWIGKGGVSVSRSVRLPLRDELSLVAPAGEWTDVELLFDGAPTLDGRSLPLTNLQLALDEPLRTDGGPVVLRVDASCLDGLTLAAMTTRELAQALSDGVGLALER